MFYCLNLGAVEIGQNMSTCSLSQFTGSSAQPAGATLNQYKGKVIYVDFWASWCGSCAKSFPFLNDLHTRYKDQGLQIVAVNLDENIDDANSFIAKHPAGFPVMTDATKQCAKDFDVKAMPSSYIVDRKGVVRHIHLGFNPGEAEDLQKIVEKLLNEKVSG
ncbi:MAG: TlpA family protein disulfide reductase [Gammaproteobacteria bacterium]|nr:TlpA family protein disulfide reductase [Gammaproteobacteria bacterium]